MMIVTCALPSPGKKRVAQHGSLRPWQLDVIWLDAHGLALLFCRRSVFHPRLPDVDMSMVSSLHGHQQAVYNKYVPGSGTSTFCMEPLLALSAHPASMTAPPYPYECCNLSVLMLCAAVMALLHSAGAGCSQHQHILPPALVLLEQLTTGKRARGCSGRSATSCIVVGH